MKRKLWDSSHQDEIANASKKLALEDTQRNDNADVRAHDLAVVARNPIVVEADELETVSDRNANSVIVRPTLTEVPDKESEQAQAMTNLYSRAMSVQREAPMLQATSKAVLDQYRSQAEEAGLALDDQLQDQVGPLHETSDDNAKRAQARFLEETSYDHRQKSDDPEVASIMREILQSIPSNNEVMATQVMREILEARDRATDLYLKVPMVNRSQRPVLQMWALSKRKPMCDLASSILARLED